MDWITPPFLAALRVIAASLEEKSIDWAVTGSLGLALQGVPVKPGDIDLQTDAAGAYAIQDRLSEFVVQPVTFLTSENIRSHLGALLIEGVRVEVMGDVEKRLVDGSWTPPPELSRHRWFVRVAGMRVPVLALAYEAEAYALLGRLERAALIRGVLSGPVLNRKISMEKSRSKFLAFLEESPKPVLADGAMGSMLHAHGVDYGHFDEVNLTKPEVVVAVHQAYIEAGAQVVMTNTFGANRYKLAEHGLEGKLVEINWAGVAHVRAAAAAAGREVLVAGDVGPLGVRLAPFGRVQPEQARQAFTEQIRALAEAGADLIIIETITDLYEVCEAIAAARQVCTLPVVASMAYTRDDRTILGDDPVKVARRLQAAAPDLIGVNCSGGPSQILRILGKMREVAPGLRFSVMPNAGFPEQVSGRIMYPASPDYFGEYARAFQEAGASLIGGCCGTTPDHIRAMRQALDQAPPRGKSEVIVLPQLESEAGPIEADQPTALARRLAEEKFAVAVEMQPPRGLSPHKLLAGASLLAEAGADVINVADSPMARMRMSPWAVCSLIQRKIKIETTLHFPTRGRNLLRVQGDLLAAHALKVRNVFVVMGDPTEIGDYPDAMDDYDLVPSGLIQLIKQEFNVGVDHAGLDIGAPTSFFVGAALNLTPADPEREIRVLQRKIKAGADFLISQPVYQPEAAEAFLERYAALHGPLQLPVLAGVLPLYNARHAAFLHNEVPGINIPLPAIQRLQHAGDAAAARVGVEIALELADKLKPLANGLYLIPAFSRYDLVAEIIESLK